MTPDVAGLIRHTTRRVADGMSKWVPSRACVSCSVRWRNHSSRAGPAATRPAGSASRAARAAGTREWPSSPATVRSSAAVRANSAQPYSYTSSRSTVAPRKLRAVTRYRSPPTPSTSDAAGASSARRNAANPAVAAVASRAPRCSRAASGPSGQPSTNRP